MTQSFDRIKLIGKGGFAEIYLIREKNTKELFAMKVIDKSKLNEKEASLIENEIKILSYANHPNIIKLYKVMNDVNNINYQYLILEYCNGGSLHNTLDQYISKYKKPFSEKLVQKIMKNILSGVKYLHDKGIIHRDLKLDNILVKYQNEFERQTLNIYNAEIKIIDFNISYLPNLNEPMTVVGTVPNMAPTIVKNIMVPGKHYDEKVDIWSLGTLCYEMLFGKPLFASKNEKQILMDILSGNFSIPKTISIQARNFLFCMLRKQGINRLTATELLNNEFIVGDYRKFKHYDVNTNNNNNLLNNINANNNSIINKNIMKHCSTEPNYDNKIMNKFNMVPKNNYNPICVGCGKNIKDFIYKCSSCFGLSICENCYLNSYKTHPHNILKCKLVPFQQTNINEINKYKSGPQELQKGGNQKGPKSEHKHPLNYRQHINDQCKICLENIRGQAGYKCGQCEVVLCTKCAKRIFYGNKRKAVHKHYLALTFRRSWICDLCRKTYDDKASFYCESCDFDACDKCYIQY